MLKFKVIMTTMLAAGTVNYTMEKQQPQLLQSGQPTLGDISTTYLNSSTSAQASNPFAQAIPGVIQRIQNLTEKQDIEAASLAHQVTRLQTLAQQRAKQLAN